MNKHQLKPLLWHALKRPNDVTFIKLLISLLLRNDDDATPLLYAINGHADEPVVALLQAATAAYELRDYPALISLCGPPSVLSHLHSLSLRTATMLSLLRHHRTLHHPLPPCPTTSTAINLLTSLYDHEQGIVRDIFSYAFG